MGAETVQEKQNIILIIRLLSGKSNGVYRWTEYSEGIDITERLTMWKYRQSVFCVRKLDIRIYRKRDDGWLR